MSRHETRRLGISGPGSALRRNHDLEAITPHQPCATELLNSEGKTPNPVNSTRTTVGLS